MTPDEFEDQLRSGQQNLKSFVYRRIQAHMFEIEANAKDNFTGDDLRRTKSGRRIWEKTGNSGYRIGPRNITGNLRSSIAGNVALLDDEVVGTITAGKKTPVVYAAAIEFGYPPRNLLPRMYIGRAFEEQQKHIEPRLKDLLTLAIFGGSDA
jgi:hypothetical protein